MLLITPRVPTEVHQWDREIVAALASSALTRELRTWPKPGLVSHVDSGSHRDMDAIAFQRSIRALRPYFGELFSAGCDRAPMDRLRTIGLAAEQAMMLANGGINTHRGAIFGLGLLCAAAGIIATGGQRRTPGVLGRCVRRQWGRSIRCGPIPFDSHGIRVLRRFGVCGARAQAAAGFPDVYYGLKAFRSGRRLRQDDKNAARVHAFFAILADLDDTNLLYRGGREGLRHAQAAASAFLARGGVGRPDWQTDAMAIHADFVARDLSPGGCADVLAMALFVDSFERLS